MRKFSGICFITGTYLIIFAIMSLLLSLFAKLNWPPLLIVLLLDVIATTVIYLIGVRIHSPSYYDPYWSVQTFAFYLFLLIQYGNWNVGTVLVLTVLAFYSIRLTVNFFIGFHDMSYVDWRYVMLRKRTGKGFQPVNYFGIHMMPTLLVYLASIPFFLYALDGAFHPLDLIALFVMVGAVVLEMVADIQMKQWLKVRESREETIEVGLWRYSRHPNYLGEISFWFGGAFLLLTHLERSYWAAGAIAILLLFLFVSIPMAEKNMLTYKPSFADYQKRVHVLLLLPQKKGKAPQQNP